jgi:hypothetical protein
MELEIEKFEFGTVPDFSLDERLDILRSFLQNNVCKVLFVKLDGSEREMKCTLKSDLLPQRNVEGKNAVKLPRPEENGVLGVYLTEDKVWRSFRINNVISIEVCDEA